MKDFTTYYYKTMPDPNLGIDIFLADTFPCGRVFQNHWHEQMQLYYFTEGRAIVQCSGKSYEAEENSVMVMNANELHSLESLSNGLKFYIIRFDNTFLFSHSIDVCQTKYLSPLSQNQILFQNLIRGDKCVIDCITSAIEEFSQKETGYELAVKSQIYQLIVLLMRKYVNRVLSEKELLTKEHNLNRFRVIFEHIHSNFSEPIHTEELAAMVHISTYHFCRLFRQLTGMTTTDYIHTIRLEKAVEYLIGTDLTITEIAGKCGFDSINYFSRLFKKHYGVSPKGLRQK